MFRKKVPILSLDSWVLVVYLSYTGRIGPPWMVETWDCILTIMIKNLKRTFGSNLGQSHTEIKNWSQLKT